MFRVHPCLWHPCEPNEKNETALSAHCFHTSNSAVRTAIKWSDIGKGHFECQLWFPGKNAFGSRKRGGWNRNGELADGQSLLAARVRLNAVAQWHSRWEYPWVKHGETAGTGGNENMKGVGIVWVGTRDVYASDVGHMTHEDPWSLNPLPNHHKPPAKNWAQVNHEFDWICRIDWARTNQIIRLCVDRTGMFFFAAWLSSALHGLKVTDGHKVGICLMFLLSISFFGVESFWAPDVVCTFAPPKAWNIRPGTGNSSFGVSCASQFLLVMTVNKELERSSKHSREW